MLVQRLIVGIRKISRNIKDGKDRKALGNKNFTIFASNYRADFKEASLWGTFLILW